MSVSRMASVSLTCSTIGSTTQMGAPMLSRVEPDHCMMPQKIAACSVINSAAKVRPLMSMIYLARSPRSILSARSSMGEGGGAGARESWGGVAEEQVEGGVEHGRGGGVLLENSASLLVGFDAGIGAS